MIKEVYVYMSYGEYSIDGGVSVLEGSDVKEKILEEMEKDWKERKNGCEDEDELEGCKEEWDEFYNKGIVKGCVGGWGYGEEGFKLYLGEGSEWFEKIEGWEGWSDEKFEEWKEFIDGIDWNDGEEIVI
jgi:hypothetical protein